MHHTEHRRWMPLASLLSTWGIPSAVLPALVADGQLIIGQIGTAFVVSETSLYDAVSVLDRSGALAALASVTPQREAELRALNLTAAAAIAGVSPKTLKKAIESGRVTAERKGPGRRAAYLLSHEALAQWQADRSSDANEVLRTAIRTTSRLTR
jgi:hypothetical protein